MWPFGNPFKLTPLARVLALVVPIALALLMHVFGAPAWVTIGLGLGVAYTTPFCCLMLMVYKSKPRPTARPS